MLFLLVALSGAFVSLPIQGELTAELDVISDRCENFFDRTNRSMTFEARLLGSATFDVGEIDLATVILEHKHGLGEPAFPLEPEPVYQDVSSLGTNCDCREMAPDGYRDAVFRFSAAEVIDAFWLHVADAGDTFKVSLRGFLLDGTYFTSNDCLLMMRPVTTTRDVAYGIHAEQVLNVYQPEGPRPTTVASGGTTGTDDSETPGIPIILFLHGTGDVRSDQHLDPIFARFAGFLDREIAIVSADYGGWPSTNYPTPQQHVISCVTWIYANAQTYGWDTTKFAIAGRSFGAMLGACVTYGDYGLSERPAAFIALDGMLDWTALDPVLPFPIVQHFGPNLMKTTSVPPQRLMRASGIQLIQRWSDPQSPPPAYAWTIGTELGEPPIQDVHDPYFGVRFVEALQNQFGDEISVATYGAETDTNVIAEWLLQVLE